MPGTWQNWSLVWKGNLMTITPSPGIGIDPRQGAVTTRAPIAFGEDYCLKPSPNFTVPIAWITEPAMDYWLNFDIKIF